jgi:hypothetical protein
MEWIEYYISISVPSKGVFCCWSFKFLKDWFLYDILLIVEVGGYEFKIALLFQLYDMITQEQIEGNEIVSLMTWLNIYE